MNNEFGYLDLKPFKEIKEDEQKLAIINEKENKLELKVKDVDKFNAFSLYNFDFGKVIETKTFYGITSQYKPLTLYRCTINSNTFRAIPQSIISSQMYIIGNNMQTPITHFTNKTRIKKIIYYNDYIKYIFPSKSFTIITSVNKINIEAKHKEDVIISNVSYKNNVITIKLINSFSYDFNAYDYNIKPTSYFEISFEKYVNFDTVLKVSNRIDSVIHLFLLTNARSKHITIYGTKKNSYEFYNLMNKNIEEKTPSFYLGKKINNILNFDRLFDLLIHITDENNNIFFPFLNFDRNIVSTEIQFLEYYRVLEYTNSKINKNKNSHFLVDLLEKYPIVKKKFFKNEKNSIIEEEVRALRNYYSHNGYYISELPIPTFKPARYKKINNQWLYNVKNFVKVVSYLEIYSLAGIEIDENYLLCYLK